LPRNRPRQPSSFTSWTQFAPDGAVVVSVQSCGGMKSGDDFVTFLSGLRFGITAVRSSSVRVFQHCLKQRVTLL
jgi:hypothetical protein